MRNESLDAHHLGKTLTVYPRGPLFGSLAAPGSKSVTNRVLALAAIANGTSTIQNALVSDDSAAMTDVITSLGAAVSVDDATQTWTVTGLNGTIAPTAALTSEPLNCRLSGTTIRFASAIAALSQTPVTLGGLPPLLRRPIGPLMQALTNLGATATSQNGYPPVTVHGGLSKPDPHQFPNGILPIDATGSSQYVSAILMAAPYAKHPLSVQVTGEHASAYIDLTVQAIQTFGGEITKQQTAENEWLYTVANTGLTAANTAVEFDASAAAHLWGIAMTTGGKVTVTNATPTAQGDIQILDIFEAFGGTVTKEGNAITVEGPVQPVSPGCIDLTDLPDQITTLSAVAAVAEGTTTYVGASVVRGHEVDRIRALATELDCIGVPVEELPDGLVITGVEQLEPHEVATYHDHRLAMSFAALGLRLPGITIQDPGCVDKTFPRFFTCVSELVVQP